MGARNCSKLQLLLYSFKVTVDVIFIFINSVTTRIKEHETFKRKKPFKWPENQAINTQQWLTAGQKNLRCYNRFCLIGILHFSYSLQCPLCHKTLETIAKPWLSVEFIIFVLQFFLQLMNVSAIAEEMFINKGLIIIVSTFSLYQHYFSLKVVLKNLNKYRTLYFGRVIGV